MARPLTPWRCRRLVSLQLKRCMPKIAAGKIRKDLSPFAAMKRMPNDDKR
jgi:hypothetical protein